MSRFNFTEILLTSKANIEDIMNNFNLIEENAALQSDLDEVIAKVTSNTNNIATNATNIATKAPINHANSDTTYGVGTDTIYGHCRVLNQTDRNVYVQGEALSAYQGYYLKGLINGKAPTSHASSGTGYGVGDADNYGHCRVTNYLTVSKHETGLALSAYQGYVLNNAINSLKTTVSNNTTAINGKAPTSHASTETSYGLGSSDKYGHVKLINNLNASSYSAGAALAAKQGYELAQRIQTAQSTANTAQSTANTAQGNAYNAIQKINGVEYSLQSYKNSMAESVHTNAIQSKYMYNNNLQSNSPNLYITSNGNFRRTTGSSKRWKKDITTNIEERLNPKALYDLPVKQFKYKDDCISKDDVRYEKNILGFIAEDVAEIYEPATQYDENGNIEMWNSNVMIPAMLKLIQEQNERIKALESKEG